MYSWEIDSYLKSRNYVINRDEYINIIDVNSSKQIVYVKYDAYSNSFYVDTNDGYHWNFCVKE